MSVTIPFNVLWVVLPLLAVVSGLGLLAIFSPSRFAGLSQNSSRWIDSNKFLEKIDEPINVDHLVLRHSRLFGLAVVVASLFLAYLCYMLTS